MTPDLQHGVHLALVWLGFGAAAGLVARIILPLKYPTASAGTIVVGVIGSALGLFVYSLLFDPQREHPLSWGGFAASLVACWVVLLAYQPWAIHRGRRLTGGAPTPEDQGAAPPA